MDRKIDEMKIAVDKYWDLEKSGDNLFDEMFEVDDMRIALAFIVVILGANIGLSVVNKFQEIQDNRLDKYCQIDPSYCQTK